jgi:hypothetical protein
MLQEPFLLATSLEEFLLPQNEEWERGRSASKMHQGMPPCLQLCAKKIGMKPKTIGMILQTLRESHSVSCDTLVLHTKMKFCQLEQRKVIQVRKVKGESQLLGFMIFKKVSV